MKLYQIYIYFCLFAIPGVTWVTFGHEMALSFFSILMVLVFVVVPYLETFKF